MNRLQSIENALFSINETVFQELCDSFLILRNKNYRAFSRTGSQLGKQKTIKGTPDTFLLLPNGKYLFVEYSTNITAGVTKLEDDIKKCIESTKTGIPTNQIAEIILCVNFKLKVEEAKSLQNLLSETRIRLTIYTLDALALEIHLQHRNLAHQYLSLPLDTGQIVSIQTFIQEYNKASTGTATPLNNTFLHRKAELSDLKVAITKSDFVILTGTPGIGKTKLALETINSFVNENPDYEAYCISYKNHVLLDDLHQYLRQEKNYILFVDDANRIDAFNQILGFYKGFMSSKLKIIVTVRDYAYHEIGMLAQPFSPIRIDVPKLTDEQIIDIIKEKPFEILNPIYHHEIVRIADGNPRLAIMTSLLAKEKQDISALADVSNLFEKYFTTFILDKGEFSHQLNIKCLGIISFFYTLPYKDQDIITPILENFKISYNEFINVIDRLDQLELVELQFDHVKIPEQNLATYFFYKAFIKDELLRFDTLLDNYFETNTKRFKDCVIPANNTFGYENVMLKLHPYLRKHWHLIKNEENRAFRFLNSFWFYLQDEALEFSYNIISSLPEKHTEKYIVSYEMNDFAYDHDHVIDLLGRFFRFPDQTLNDAMELSFEYARKLPEHLPELIHKIREVLTFDREDERSDYQRQNVLYEMLLNGLRNSNKLIVASFYELTKTFLSFQFRHTQGGRNNSIVLYQYPIPNNKSIQSFREKIWLAVNEYFLTYPDLSIDLLSDYGNIQPDTSKEIMEYDLPYVIDIIEKNLRSTEFDHCRYVQKQLRWWKRNDIYDPIFDDLTARFTSPLYDMYIILDWDRLRDKEMFEFDDYKEYDRLKEQQIRSSFILNGEEEVKDFYKNFIFIKGISNRDWSFNNSLDFIIDENCNRNFDMGHQLFLEIIKNNNIIDFIPRISFRNHLKTEDTARKIWSLIQKNSFHGKENWEFSFYDHLKDNFVNEEYLKALISTVQNLKGFHSIHFDGLKKFLTIEPDLFKTLLEVIYKKNEEENTRLNIWIDFFREHFDDLIDDLNLLKKVYLQQDRMQEYFDFESEGLLRILLHDKSFLVEYIKSLHIDNEFKVSTRSEDLSLIWKVDKIEPYLTEVFDLIVENGRYYSIGEHFCNVFFKSVTGETYMRAKEFLKNYTKENYNNSRKMNMIVDIIRNSMKRMFDDFLLFYISLTQDVDIFSQLQWRGNGGVYRGDIIIGDIEASEWKTILSIVEKSPLGYKLIPIKKYINDRIESSLRYGDLERQRRFIERY